MTEEHAPYRTSADAATANSASVAPAAPRKRVRTVTLQQMKERGEHFTMLTSYDMLTAQIFDEAGIELLLVGDSVANNVLGYDTTLPVTVDEMISFTRAVARGATHSLVVADLPFGSYQESPQQAFRTAARFMKEAGAHAVKLEGGAHMAETIKHLTLNGIPVIAHIGFTPQSEHTLGGYRVQGRGDAAARLLVEAETLQDAGAFCVLMEMVPAPIAAEVTQKLRVPTIGIGAGAGTDGQVLVWQDFSGLRTGRMPRFVKQFANLRENLLSAAVAYRDEVKAGTFPDAEHSFES